MKWNKKGDVMLVLVVLTCILMAITYIWLLPAAVYEMHSENEFADEFCDGALTKSGDQRYCDGQQYACGINDEEIRYCQYVNNYEVD